MQGSVNIREVIADVLLHHEKSQEYSHQLVQNTLQKFQYLSVTERSFIKRVVEGSIERRIELDYILNLYSSVPVKKMKPFIRTVMRMSVYQLLYMEQVPDSAICNEAVKLVEKRKFKNLKGFTNGVLRKISREKDKITYPSKEQEPIQYLSIKYSMPEWLILLWNKTYGIEVTKNILEGLLAIKPVSFRTSIHSSEEERKQWVEQLRSQGVNIKEHPYSPYIYLATQTDQIALLPGYEEGFFSIQDYTSSLAVQAAGIKTGDQVLDLCAAPGGKSILAAEYVGNDGCVVARDVSEYKIEQIMVNTKRMKTSPIKIEVWDARERDYTLQEKVDVVLADVPCSGLGIIGKKGDIKYRITKDSLEEIVTLQKEIISASVSYIKKGGILLYSTCTIHIQENEEMVKWICDEFSFTLESLDEFIPPQLKTEETKKGYLQLFPEEKFQDGFFLARLRK